jgi:hypothetical protein
VTNEWKEKLAVAGKKHDGHVTHGSLAEQEKVIDEMLRRLNEESVHQSD